VNGGLSISEGPFGRKVGKHAAAFGLDASRSEHRERLRAMIGEISASPDMVVEGNFRGRGRVRFFVKEDDVVAATLSDEFVTFLKGEISNPSVRKALRYE
jgi:hypothetical protein